MANLSVESVPLALPIANVSLAPSAGGDGDTLLPAAVQSIVALLLIAAVLYGSVGSTLLFVLLIKSPHARKHAGFLLLVLLVINICCSVGPSFTFLLWTLHVSESVSIIHALCRVGLVGMVFMHGMNAMIMTSMAVQRYCLVVSRRPVGSRFIVASVISMAMFAIMQTMHQTKYPGLSFHICIGSIREFKQGINGTMWVLALPLVVCCGLCISFM